MDRIKCKCGHENPNGTKICELCGRSLDEGKLIKKGLLDMRYEGSARRSQTYNKTSVDKIWNFFSSVKVGVWLIVITLVASALGTIFPQQMYIPPTIPPNEYYYDQYGIFGLLYYNLGFHNLYNSWWYMLMIASIGISLVIASLDRVVPLYKALKKQGITRHETFLRRQRLFSETEIELDQETLGKIKKKMLNKRYKVREENGNILAEKGRFSRWGPYVNHTGLVIFLIGAMLRFVPGMYIDDVLWIREGETKEIPKTGGQYYLKNESFILETYEKDKENEVFNDAIQKAGDGTVAKNYQTNVTLYEQKGDTLLGEEAELVKVKDFQIRVNEPLKHDYYALYQVDFKLNELSQMSFKLLEKETDTSFGEIDINLYEPNETYDLGKGYKVEIVNYYPDFYFNSNGDPASKSKVPNNPAFVFKMISPEKPEGEISFVAIQQTIEAKSDNRYKMAFNGIETKHVSALTVRRDFTLGILAVGGFIFMIGVIQGMYWNHRRIWVMQKDGKVYVAGHSNKNWFGVKKEADYIFEDTSILSVQDQLDQGGEKSG